MPDYIKEISKVHQKKFKSSAEVQAEFMEEFRDMKTRITKLEEKIDTLERSKNGYFKLT